MARRRVGRAGFVRDDFHRPEHTVEVNTRSDVLSKGREKPLNITDLFPLAPGADREAA
jgi:hypothetical protein